MKCFPQTAATSCDGSILSTFQLHIFLYLINYSYMNFKPQSLNIARFVRFFFLINSFLYPITISRLFLNFYIISVSIITSMGPYLHRFPMSNQFISFQIHLFEKKKHVESRKLNVMRLFPNLISLVLLQVFNLL